MADAESTRAPSVQQQADAGKLRADLEWMGGICRHQSNRLFPPPFNRIHAYTCGNDSRHAVLFPLLLDGLRVLVCPDCDYVQVCGKSTGCVK